MDAKGRVSVPASYRRILAEGDPDGGNEGGYQFVLVYSTRGKKCLEGYTVSGIESIEDRLDEMDEFSDERELAAYLLSGQSDYIPVEASGRCVLPERYRAKVGLEAGEIVFLGLGNRFQIWQRNDFEKHQELIEEKRLEMGDPLAGIRGKRERSVD